jgi:hypothetical protein
MPIPLKKPGDPLRFKAAHWNRIAQVVNSADGDLTPGGGALAFARSGIIVPVRNNAQTDLDRFSVLGIIGPANDPESDLPGFQRERLLDGGLPDESKEVGRFAIMLEPVENGKIASGLIAGICPVLLDVADENEDDFADIRDGDTTRLTTGPTGGAYVVWRKGGTGEQWALVMVGTPAWLEATPGDEYMFHQLRKTGGVIRPVWDWARMHQ